MSRSYRHSPIIGITCADSEAEFKAKSARILRKKQRQLLRSGIDPDDLILPVRSRDVVESYLGPKDGWQRFDPRDKEMRKYLRK